MAISPERSQVETIPDRILVSEPANTASMGKLPDPEPLQQSEQSGKDEMINRLKRKVEELELINKSSMSMINRELELEQQLGSKTSAYDQLKLSSMVMEKLLKQSNERIQELVKADLGDEQLKDADSTDLQFDSHAQVIHHFFVLIIA